MKKFGLIITVLLVSMLCFGCNNKADENKTDVDMDLVGAWQLEDENHPELYIFTEDSEVKVVSGSISFEGEASFKKNSDGKGTYLSNFYYMAGELSYTIEGDKVTFDDGEGTTQTLKKAEYTAPEIKKYDEFNSKNPLIGTWANEEYSDSYTFNSDGTATYVMDFGDLEYVSKIDYTYTEKDGKVYFTFDSGEGLQEISSVYTINGDTLLFDGTAEYTRQ